MTLYLFPLNFAFNSFSLSLLVVMAGLSGHSSMAADLSLSQAAMIAIFFSMSANARNLILKSSDGAIERSIVQMRLLSAPVLAVAAVFVSVYLSKVNLLISLAIVVRQLSEWFSEIELARMERTSDHKRAKVFLAVFVFPLLAIAGALLFAPPFFLPALYIWAGLPLLLCSGGISRSLATLSMISIEWAKILPNCGSTFIIGMTVFFFRLLIAGFAGKDVAGQLFAAFALGSIVGSLYERTIGPSFKVSAELAKASSLMFRLAWVLPAAGVGLVVMVCFLGGTNSYVARNVYLLGATGFSLVGGFVMLGAQTIKINILHSNTRDDVFMADLLSNFAILVSVPVTFLLFGEAAFVMLFMTNAVIVYSAYWLMNGNPLANYTSGREKIVHGLTAFAIVAPLFFQLGGGVYRGGQEVYNWGGALSMLPLPLSVFLFAPLILLMHSFRGVKSFSVFAFSVFSIMMCGTVVSSSGDAAAVKDKLLISLQYLLPFFGLVLAEHAGTSAFFLKRMARVFLSVVIFVVILQLGVTFYSGVPRLQSYLYLFGIYNNSQYAVVILVSAYLLALFSLYSSGRERNKLLFMWPFMCLYAALSRSMFALGLLLCGLILFWIISGARSKIGLIFLLGVLISGAAGVYSLRYEAGGSLAKKMEHPMVSGLNSRDEAVRPTASPGSGDIAAARESLSYLFSADMDARSAIWSFYLQGMKKADTKTLLFGHSAVPQRNVYPSAHNYYLDILYNFGFVTLLPVLLLILYTLRLTWDKRMEVLRHPQLLGLGFIVFFLIFVENSFKVGLRQPYSGIYSFFLWGLFISHLRIAGGARTDKSSMKIAVLNLTGGGISGGHRKYLVNILPRLEALVKTGTILCASPASINVKGWLTADTSISFAECETFKPFLHSPSAALRSTLDLFNPELLFIPIERYIKYKGLPVVVMLQNMAPLTGAKTGTGLKEWLVSIMRRYETRYALKRAAAVIVPTAYVRDFLIGQERINARKIFLIPYGNSPLPPAPVKPAGFPFADSKFIFTAGSMEIYRGVEDLVRAFPAVKAGNPGVKLVVAGGTRTETKRYLAGLKETASRLGVGDDVVYLGNIEEAELSWCYSNCSAFALTSRVESFCFVALEAMAHGCSIVSTDSACLPEIFKDVAFYYKPGDEKGLSRALLSILSRTEAERLVISSAAVAQAASFSWDAAAAATLGVLKKAVPAS